MAEGSGAAPVLLVEDAAAVTTITLNRPDRGNALTTELKTELLAVLTHGHRSRCARRRAHRAGGAFCAGQDLAEHAAALDADPAAAFETIEQHYAPIVTTLATMPKPVLPPSTDASGPVSGWPWPATCASPPPAPAWRRRSRRSG